MEQFTGGMNFEKKIDFAKRLIELSAEAAVKEGERVEVAYSGGKDSDVLLYLAKGVLGSDFVAIYKNTTIDPPRHDDARTCKWG